MKLVILFLVNISLALSNPVAVEGPCQDLTIKPGKFWTDSMHFPCGLYEGAAWCTATGEEGEGWNHFWGHFGGFAAHGHNARQACCGCGGGNRDPQTFDESLPEYDGVPEYPYEKIDYHFSADDHTHKPCYKCTAGLGWHDSWGYSCRAYYYGSFCTVDGKRGPGWNLDEYGSIHSYHNAGKDAFQACGACGLQ